MKIIFKKPDNHNSDLLICVGSIVYMSVGAFLLIMFASFETARLIILGHILGFGIILLGALIKMLIQDYVTIEKD